MSQHYSDPSRASDPHALPDVEVFYCSEGEPLAELVPVGWYWWSCLPGCLPDGEPNGPFDSEEEAVNDAQEDAID